MTAMADRLIDLVDLIVWRVPTPGQMARMSDLDAEQRYVTALSRDRQRIGSVLGAEIERRDRAAKAARIERENRERLLAKGRQKRRGDRYEYDLFVHAMFLQAERDCRGVLITSAAFDAGIDPISLFSGPEARAMRLASEELRNWWQDHPRITLAEWKRQSRETYDPTAPAAA